MSALSLCIVAALVFTTGGCGRSRAEFERQLEFCTVAENNGLLEPAEEGCLAALSIAEVEKYESPVLSDLLYRLGRLARQQSHFGEAEERMRRSLELAEASGKPEPVAVRLAELALILAGQGRWQEGTRVLERASPLVDDLEGRDRNAAAGAFNLFSVRLRNLGDTETADAFARRLGEL